MAIPAGLAKRISDVKSWLAAKAPVIAARARGAAQNARTRIQQLTPEGKQAFLVSVASGTAGAALGAIYGSDANDIATLLTESARLEADIQRMEQGGVTADEQAAHAAAVQARAEAVTELVSYGIPAETIPGAASVVLQGGGAPMPPPINTGGNSPLGDMIYGPGGGGQIPNPNAPRPLPPPGSGPRPGGPMPGGQMPGPGPGPMPNPGPRPSGSMPRNAQNLVAAINVSAEWKDKFEMVQKQLGLLDREVEPLMVAIAELGALATASPGTVSALASGN